MDDTASLGEPLHGRGHWHVTFPGHTKPPNEVKEAGIIREKQPKHVKAKNESKIAQAEFYIAKARKSRGRERRDSKKMNSEERQRKWM